MSDLNDVTPAQVLRNAFEQIDKHEATITQLEKTNGRISRMLGNHYCMQCARAVPENNLTRLERERDELRAEVLKWKRIRTPTHGTCCTCQACGEYYEQCRCDLDDVADDLVQAREIIGQLEEKLRLAKEMRDHLGNKWAEAKEHVELLQSQIDLRDGKGISLQELKDRIK